MLSVTKPSLLGQRCRRIIHHDSMHSYRIGDILHDLFAQVLVAEGQLILDVIMNSASDTDPPRNCQTLEPCGNVDPIPIESLTFHDHIAQVNANAKLHLPVFRQFCILDLKCALDLDGTAHGVHDTGELG